MNCIATAYWNEPLPQIGSRGLEMPPDTRKQAHRMCLGEIDMKLDSRTISPDACPYRLKGTFVSASLEETEK